MEGLIEEGKKLRTWISRTGGSAAAGNAGGLTIRANGKLLVHWVPHGAFATWSS